MSTWWHAYDWHRKEYVCTEGVSVIFSAGDAKLEIKDAACTARLERDGSGEHVGDWKEGGDTGACHFRMHRTSDAIVLAGAWWDGPANDKTFGGLWIVSNLPAVKP